MIFVNETTYDKVLLPNRVYKYRTWNKDEHKRLLTESEIFFAAPLDMDEQHECNLPVDYDSITDKKIYDYAYLRAPEFGITSPELKEKFAQDTVKFTPFREPSHRVSTEERFRGDLNNQLSIFCVSEHRDNYNLWSTFAGGQSGYCVGIDTRGMLKEETILGGAGKVVYYPADNPPKRRALCFTDLERIQDMLQVIFSLPDFFAQEDEYRLFKFNIANRRVNISPESIQEIILGEYIKLSHKQEIIDIVRQKYPHAKTYQSQYDYDLKYFVFKEIE